MPNQRFVWRKGLGVIPVEESDMDPDIPRAFFINCDAHFNQKSPVDNRWYSCPNKMRRAAERSGCYEASPEEISKLKQPAPKMSSVSYTLNEAYEKLSSR